MINCSLEIFVAALVIFSLFSANGNGTGNVFIGNSAGSSLTGSTSNKLVIDNGDNDYSNPLIKGSFDDVGDSRDKDDDNDNEGDAHDDMGRAASSVTSVPNLRLFLSMPHRLRRHPTIFIIYRHKKQHKQKKQH